MSKVVTDKDALKALDQIKGTQRAIKQRGAKEYAPWIGWGLFLVLFCPGFDYINPAIWGPTTWIVAMTGWLLTFRYFQKRQVKIKTLNKTPWYGWFIYGLWIAIGVAFASALDSHFQFAWTVAGFAIGLPFIAYGLKLKSQA